MSYERPPLYHYTDANGLLGMIQAESLWLTAHSFLNDSTEFVDGYKRLNHAINEHVVNTKFKSGNTANYLAELRKILDEAIIFSCSFSREGDLLSQWRAYTPVEGGYCVRFDWLKLQRTAEAHRSKANHRRLEECIYDETKKDRQAKVIAEGIINGLDLHADNNFPTIFFNSFLEFLHYTARCKSQYFSEENEVRLITYGTTSFGEIVASGGATGRRSLNITQPEGLLFRTRAGVLTPYVIHPIGLDCIQEIRIGPHRSMDVAEKGLRYLIAQHDELKECEISSSSIPFRG